MATPRDLAVLGRSLAPPARCWRAALEDAEAGELGGVAGEGREPARRWATIWRAEIAAELARVLRADAPAATKDGGFVNAGVSPELDELRDIAAGGRDRIAAIEARERERTGIPSLKVRYNSVFGYYIEVTRAHLASVPADYRRKQTVANAERFVTPELGEFEQTVLSADERRIALELEIFAALRAQVAAAAEPAARAGGAGRGGRHAGGARRGRAPPRLLPPRGRRQRRHRARATRATRWSSGWRRRARSCPTTSASTRRPSRSCSSPAPTWRASRR